MSKQNIDIEVTGHDKGAGSMLDSLAQKARMIRHEGAASGENALGRVLDQGAGGIAEFGLKAVGWGAKGLIADFVGKSLSGLSKAALDVSEGKDPSEMIVEFAKSLPVLGGFAEAIQNIYQMATGMGEAIKDNKLDQDADEAGVAAYKSMRDRQHSLNETLRQSQAGASIAGLFTSPHAQQLAQAHENRRRLVEAEGDQEDANFAKRTAENATALGFRNSQVNAAQSKLDHLNSIAASLATPSMMGGVVSPETARAELASNIADAKKELDDATRVRQDLMNEIKAAKAADDKASQTTLVADLKKNDDEIAELQWKFDEDQQKRARASAETLLDIAGGANVARLLAAKQSYAAQDEASKDALQKQARTLQQVYIDNLKSGMDPTAAMSALGLSASGLLAAFNSNKSLTDQERDEFARHQRDASGDTVGGVDSEIDNLSGKTLDAAKRDLALRYNDRIKQIADQLADPQLDPDARTNLLKSAAGISVARDEQLRRLGLPNVSLEGRTAPTSDRFASGASEALLSRTAAADTAQNTKDLLQKVKDFYDAFTLKASTTSGDTLRVAIIDAAGVK